MRAISLSVTGLLGALTLMGCTPPAGPPASVPGRARARFLVQKQFRVGTFDFGDQEQGKDTRTIETGSLKQALPAMLLTELREIGRFAVYEGGNIRSSNGNEALQEGNAEKFVDGYLSGTITSVTADQVCFDVRLANAVNHEVLFTRNACTPLQYTDTVMAPARDGIKRIADEMSRAVKQIGYGKVTSADGELVFVDKGASAGVMRGMVAYLVPTGDSVRDKNVHTAVAAYTGVDESSQSSTPVIVGELYIVSVEDSYSVGLLFHGDYAMPQDTVFFK